MQDAPEHPPIARGGTGTGSGAGGGAGGAPTVIAILAGVVLPWLSVTLTTKFDVPPMAPLGVPEIRPLLLRVSPVGNPPSTDHWYGGMPPVALNSVAYESP